MYKIPSLPSPQANIHDFTDFTEVECLKNNIFSRQDIISCLSRYNDDFIEERKTNEEILESKIDDIFNEIETRIKIFNDKYPFEVDNTGYIIKVKHLNDKYYYLYCYLLLCTRFNMNDQKNQNDIDGTFLFEKLSEQIASNYFGERSESFITGTSSTISTFEQKINELTKLMKEGKGYKVEDEDQAKYQKDDNLDIVVWKSFYDEYPGKLIGFGQCKTGTNWNEKLTSLQPDKFCETWFKSTPIVTPIRLFFICDLVERQKWNRNTRKAGIFFDRCRILDYCENISEEVIRDIKTWTDGAKSNLFELQN